MSLDCPKCSGVLTMHRIGAFCLPCRYIRFADPAHLVDDEGFLPEEPSAMLDALWPEPGGVDVDDKPLERH